MKTKLAETLSRINLVQNLTQKRALSAFYSLPKIPQNKWLKNQSEPLFLAQQK